MRTPLLLISLAAFSVQAGEPVRGANATDVKPVVAIPANAPSVRDLFRPFEGRSYALSPSGKLMVETRSTAPQYWDDPDAAPPLASQQVVQVVDVATGRAINLTQARAGVYSRGTRWLDDSRLVWHTADLTVRKLSAELVLLGPGADGTMDVRDVRTVGREAVVLASRDQPRDRVWVQMSDEDGASVYMMDPGKSFERQRIPANRIAGPVRGLEDWVFDDQGAVRAYSVHRRRGDVRVYFRDTPTAPFRKVYELPFDRYQTSSLVGFDAARNMLLMITDHGTDKRVLRELDPRTGQLGRIVVGDARNDVSSGSYHPRTGKLIGVALNDSTVRYEFLDPRIKALQTQMLKLTNRKVVSVIAVSDDLSRAVAYAGGPGDPGEFMLYEAAGNKVRSLAKLAPWLNGVKLGDSRAIELKARDGITLTGVYTPAAAARFARTPLIVMPHGGPFGVRDYLYFDPEVQFLATRGYSVLQVDFRGSGGYGRDFLKAGYRQWGKAMQDDITDAVKHAVTQGWASADKVCIFGGSYGGYAAVMGLIKTPELYQCGATLAGVSDLSLLFKSREVKNDKYLREWLKDAVGDPEKEKAELKANSPAYLAKGLKRPLFIAHGEDDTRAEPEHAWRLKSAIEAGGGKVEWMMVPKQGHGYDKPKHIEEFYERLDAFFAQHLAGT